MTVTRSITAVLALVLSLSGVAQEDAPESVVPPIPGDIRALLFHPPVAEAARRLTLAMALVSGDADTPSGAEAWRTAVAAEQRRLADLAALSPVTHASLIDGRFAALVRAMAVPEVGLPETDEHAVMLDWLSRPRQPALDAAVAAHWQAGAHLYLDRVWRAAAVGLEAPEAVASVWQPLLATAGLDPEAAGSGGGVVSGPPDLRGQALRLGRLSARLATSDEAAHGRALLDLNLALAEVTFDRGHVLDGLWHAFGAVLAGRDRPGDVVDLDLAGRLNRLNQVHREALLGVDPVLGGVLAQLADAAADLAGTDGTAGAGVPLADAYAQLALFVTDAAFYLDQPVRQGVRADVEACRAALAADVPVARARYEACLEDFLALTGDTARSSELTGEADGAFAPEYLRRETGLVAAQRMDFLLGYVDWELGGGCEAPGWFNVLEWSLGASLVEWWAARRPAYFTAPRWQEAVARARRGATTYSENLATHLDCLTGQGAQRRDPVERLLDALDKEIDTLARHLETARTAYRDQVLAPGSDVRLDGDPALTTRYRPENLVVEPCDPERTCGVSERLPVSRALVGLFPEAYLVADQTGMGRVELCYDRIEWVDRISRPARARDDSVADFHGRLAFDLVGRFRPEGAPADEVFRMRLTGEERHHYLFGAAGKDTLARTCPRELVGTPVESRLPESVVSLVPDRLTYFVTAPVTPEKVVAANWDERAEWRDRFVTGRGVDVLERDDGSAYAPAVVARIRELSAGLQRELAGRMLRPPLMNEGDPLTLSMTRVAGLKDLLRRLLELAYPGLLRHGDAYRAAFTGDSALPDRDLVRRLRAAQAVMAGLPGRARSRIDNFRDLWRMLPALYREGGQVPPELVHGLLTLYALEAASPAPVSAGAAARP